MRLSAIPEAQRAEAVSQFNARFGEMERVLWRVRITAALAVAAVLAGALAGCETPSDRDAHICATAADPVAIANQAGATSLGGPVPEGNDSCILSADGTNATRTGTWDFGPGVSRSPSPPTAARPITTASSRLTARRTVPAATTVPRTVSLSSPAGWRSSIRHPR